MSSMSINFRDTFASRLREAREQAKDLTSKLNFDEMAATDAYIHCEEYNVQGQPRAYEKTKSERIKTSLTEQELCDHRHPEQRQGTTMDSVDEAASSSSAKASSSAWHSKQQPATPLLSIVTDTLQDTPPAVKSTRSNGINHVLPNLSNASSSYDDDDDDVSFSGDDDEDESDSDHNDDDDENDPILAMMQGDKEYSKRKKRRKKKKNFNKNRFMEDLDRRMEKEPNDALHPALEIEQGSDPAEFAAPSPYFTRGPFGGAVLNLAMNKINHIVKKSSNGPRSGATSPAPPLARERKQKTTTTAPEDDFHVTNSNSVLSTSELQELESKSMMYQGTSLLQVAHLLQEHRHYVFIAFTLMFAVFVYFLTHKNLEDDVT